MSHEKPAFVPPTLESQYRYVHPDNVPADRLADMRHQIAETGAYVGQITDFGDKVGAVEVGVDGDFLKIMPGVIRIPADHPVHVIADEQHARARGNTDDLVARLQADRQAEHQESLVRHKEGLLRQAEITGRIDEAIAPVQQFYDNLLGQVASKNPDMNDTDLGTFMTTAINRHQAPAVFEYDGGGRNGNYTRDFTAVRLYPDQQLSPGSIKVQSHAAEDGSMPTFAVSMDSTFNFEGRKGEEENIPTAIFTDFNKYKNGSVPSDLYEGDMRRGEGGWRANAELLEGLVAEQFDHIGYPTK
jgi:hypothetical protein